MFSFPGPGQNPKDIFATEITEATEGLKFKKSKRKRLRPEEFEKSGVDRKRKIVNKVL
jgi:hypothetical protein